MSKTITSIRLTNTQIKQLENIANKRERTVSEQIRYIIDNYLDNINNNCS